MSNLLIIAALAAVLAVVEYFHHREYNMKHPDQQPCGSGVIGYLIIIAACIRLYFKR